MKKTIVEYTSEDGAIYFHHTIHFPSEDYLYYANECHPMVEFMYVICGDIEYTIEGKKYLIHPGDFIFLNTSEIHKLKINLSSGYERMVLQFNKDILPQNKNINNSLLYRFLLNTTANTRIIPKETTSKFKIFDFLKEIEKLCLEKPDFLNAKITVYTIELLLELNKVLVSMQNPLEPEKVHPIIQKVSFYISEHMGDPITIHDIAQSMYLSKSYLCHTFKKLMGISLNRYITIKKIQHAVYCIDTGMSPQEASIATGYNYYSSFFNNFKSIMGYAPSQKKNTHTPTK